MVNKGRCSLLLVLVLVCGLLASCVPKQGHISWQASDGVEVDLGKGLLQQGFSYYYSGQKAIPHTIIAIRDDASFLKNHWQPALNDGQQLKEWMESIDNHHRAVDDMYFGARLYDCDDRFVGIWYSKYHFFSGYFDSNGKLVILRPLRRQRGYLSTH